LVIKQRSRPGENVAAEKSRMHVNDEIMDNAMVQVRNPRFLNLTIYLIVAIMVIISYITMPDALVRAAVIALCAAFGMVHAFGFRKADTPGRLAIYLIAQTMIILTILRISSPKDFFNLFFYILALVAVLILPIRPAIAWIAGFYVLDSLNALWGQGTGGIIGVLFYAAAFILSAVFGYTLRQAEIGRQKNEKLLEDLSATQHQLQDMAVAEERTRMAREMHDSLGHRLTVSIVQLEGAQRLIPTDPDRAARMIQAMRDEMKEALAELRSTVSALRAPPAGDLPLDIALSTLSRTFQQNTGITTHFSVSPGFPGLPERHRLALYRAAQEALTNIQRHAMAHNAWMELIADNQKITLVMEDDGKGINQPPENGAGSGLLGLGERAAELEGEVRLVERDGGGTQLIFSFPWPGQGETDGRNHTSSHRG
jgi:signal transduction histidine kinase